jgi:RNA polymerase sigma-70 factor (ECF subfamily)
MSLDMNQIYKGYFDTAVSIAFKYVNDTDIAKDIAQDSMIKIWKNQDSFKPEKNKFFAWFYKIVKNTALDAYKNNKNKIMLRTDKRGLEYIECDSINVDTIDMISNLNKLQPKYSEVLSLSFIHGHTQVKIAELLEMPLGTVKSRVKSGMRDLRKIYL